MLAASAVAVEDFHPALTVLPFAVKGAEAVFETLPVMHCKLGMVCVVSVRGTRVFGKRILKGHAVATGRSGPVLCRAGFGEGGPVVTGGAVGVLYNEEEPWFTLYGFDDEDIA